MVRNGAPGTVVRAILPQGPHALGERQRAESNERGGMGVPSWGFLTGGGASEEGCQGGNPRRGGGGAPCSTPAHRLPGGRGGAPFKDRCRARGALPVVPLRAPRDAG